PRQGISPLRPTPDPYHIGASRLRHLQAEGPHRGRAQHRAGQRRWLEGELWLELETGLFKCIVEFFRRKLVAFAVGERLLVKREEIRRDRGVPLVTRLGVAPP